MALSAKSAYCHNGPYTKGQLMERDRMARKWLMRHRIDLRDYDELVQNTYTKKKDSGRILTARGQALLNRINGMVHVPYRWSRHLSEDINDKGPIVYYISPSGRVLRNLPEVKRYMREEQSCKCYLMKEALNLRDCFNFDPFVSGIQLPPPVKVHRTECQKYYKNEFKLNRSGTAKLAQRRAWVEKLIRKQAVEDCATITELTRVQMKFEDDGRPTPGRSEMYSSDEEMISDHDSDADVLSTDYEDENESEEEAEHSDEEDEEEEANGRENGEDAETPYKPETPLARVMRLFDYSKVDVLSDGRVYLKGITDCQWQHRLAEWKDTDDFSLQDEVQNVERAEEIAIVQAESQGRTFRQSTILATQASLETAAAEAAELAETEATVANTAIAEIATVSTSSTVLPVAVKGRKTPLSTVPVSRTQSLPSISPSTSSSLTVERGEGPSGLANGNPSVVFGTISDNGSAIEHVSSPRKRGRPRKRPIEEMGTDSANNVAGTSKSPTKKRKKRKKIVINCRKYKTDA